MQTMSEKSLTGIKELREWLDQFPEEDREIASEAFRQLNFIDNNRVSSTLEARIEEILSTWVREDSVVIIEPVISRNEILAWRDRNKDIVEYQANKYGRKLMFQTMYSTGSRQAFKEISIPRVRSTYVLYSDAGPLEIRDAKSGSERLLDLAARNIYKKIEKVDAFKNLTVIEHREQLRDSAVAGKVLHLFLISDNVGSGKQAAEFLESAIASVRIGLLKEFSVIIHPISYCATRQGESRIRGTADNYELRISDKGEIPAKGEGVMWDFEFFRETETFFDAYDSKNRTGERVFDLFSRYVDRNHRRRTRGQGFGGTASRDVVLGASCPNTLPEMFYFECAKMNYKPLFPERIIRGDFASALTDLYGIEVHGIHESPQFTELVRKKRLITAVKHAQFEENPIWAVLLLAVAGVGEPESIKLARAPYVQFAQAVKALRDIGWIDSNFNATTRGVNVVKNFGRKHNYSEFSRAKSYVTNKLDAGESVYYPQSVRGVQ